MRNKSDRLTKCIHLPSAQNSAGTENILLSVYEHHQVTIHH